MNPEAVMSRDFFLETLIMLHNYIFLNKIIIWLFCDYNERLKSFNSTLELNIFCEIFCFLKMFDKFAKNI